MAPDEDAEREVVIPPVGFTLKQRRKALKRFLKSMNHYEQPETPRVEARPQEDDDQGGS